MKKYLIITIGILLGVVTLLTYKNTRLQGQYSIAYENVKAYDTLLSKELNNNRVFKLTINQLSYFNDSLIDKLRTVQDDLKIKDKTILQLQYLAKEIIKIDTILLRDTIFKKDFQLDTIIGDKWVQTNLLLKYPNNITMISKIELELYLFITSKKETIKPPKRFFLTRWFLKKHTITEVIVKEMNPHVRLKEQKYIQIIK